MKYSDDYLEFYDEYPRHEGKADGQKAWNNLSKTARTAAAADVAKRKRAGFYPTNKKKIQLPASYLRAARWEDNWQDTLESSRKPEDDFVSRGAEVIPPPKEKPFGGTKWDKLANRVMLKYLRAIGGLPADELVRAIEAKQAVSRECGPPFDEDIKNGASHTDIQIDFVDVLLSRLDAATGKTLKPRLFNPNTLRESKHATSGRPT